MIKILGSVLLLAVVTTPAQANAQGGRGGFGGGNGPGRGGQRGRSDTTAAGSSATPSNFVDVVFAHRSDLQLTGAQLTAVNEIRMSAMSQRSALTRTVDSVKAIVTLSPEEGETVPTDSSRKAMMQQRRALGSALGDLHDVDVTARNKTLALLTPDQQKQAEYLQQVADSPPATKTEGARGGGRRGGGRPNGA